MALGFHQMFCSLLKMGQMTDQDMIDGREFYCPKSPLGYLKILWIKGGVNWRPTFFRLRSTSTTTSMGWA